MFDDGGISQRESRMMDCDNQRNHEGRINKELQEIYFELARLQRRILRCMDGVTKEKCLKSEVV